MLSLFRATLGDFDLDALVYANYALGPFLFILFIFLVFFVVLSMFLSIVDESYDRVRTDLEALDALGDAGRPNLERDLTRFATELSRGTRGLLTALTGLNFHREPAKIAPENDNSVSTTELVALGAGSSVGSSGGASSGGGGGEFARRREELSQEASPVAAALQGAFGTLGLLAQQQQDMVAVLTLLDDRVLKRRLKVAGLAEDFNSVDGGDKGRKNKY
jgi:hypothetical protein